MIEILPIPRKYMEKGMAFYQKGLAWDKFYEQASDRIKEEMDKIIGEVDL